MTKTIRRPILCITRGLPGSGKTTAVEKLVHSDPTRWARVSRDVLREHVYLTMPRLPPADERQMTGLHHLMVRHLLHKGRCVAVDDTNLYDEVVAEWVALAAAVGADFQILDLRHVTRDECIARDQARADAGGRFVGPEVITRIAARVATTPREQLVEYIPAPTGQDAPR